VNFVVFRFEYIHYVEIKRWKIFVVKIGNLVWFEWRESAFGTNFCCRLHLMSIMTILSFIF